MKRKLKMDRILREKKTDDRQDPERKGKLKTDRIPIKN